MGEIRPKTICPLGKFGLLVLDRYQTKKLYQNGKRLSMTAMTALLSDPDWLSPTGGPRYLQLRRKIQSAIDSGLVKENDSLPSEREIAAITGLSRVTVRNAVAELVLESILVQKRGSGTFVASRPRKVEQSLSRLTSFTEDMARRGMNVDAIFLERGIFAPSPQESFTLGLPQDAMVARISRLRRADGVPLAIERASLPLEILPDPSLVTQSLYAVLELGGNRPIRAVQRISATNVEGEDARHLNMAPGQAGLRIERVSYLDTGRVVEFTRSLYRGDAYDFVAELQITK
jgi:GntR family transcriptional regulator